MPGGGWRVCRLRRAKIALRMIEFPALGLTAPDGSIIGVIEEGTRADLASSSVSPGSGDAFSGGLGNYLLDNHALSALDAISKARIVSKFVQLRRAGATYVLRTH